MTESDLDWFKAETVAAGKAVLDRGGSPEDLAAAMGEIFEAFAAASVGAGGTFAGAQVVQAFCDQAFASARRRAARLDNPKPNHEGQPT